MFEKEKKLKSKRRQMPDWAKKVIAVFAMVILFMVIVASVAYGAVYYQLSKIERVDPEAEGTEDWIPPENEFFDTDFIETDPPVPETSIDSNGNIVTIPPVTTQPSPDTSVQIDAVKPIEEDQLINILLVGQDRRPGQGRQRSDTMMLVSINPETKQISVISFLRDLYVQIPGGYSDNRLNTPYVNGGFKLLDKTLLLNFGVTIDYNVEVDFTGFERIIDVMGGVTINLTQAEVDYMHKNITDSVKVGENRLNGKQALEYARIRKIDSDFGRTNRQRNIIMSIFNEAKTLPVGKLYDMIDEICANITTDMSNSDIFSLAADLIPMLSSMKIEQYHVPDDGQYYNATIRKMQVLVPYTSKIRKALAEEYLPLKR